MIIAPSHEKRLYNNFVPVQENFPACGTAKTKGREGAGKRALFPVGRLFYLQEGI